MPDRVVRDELLESERWLGLKDNADRLAYIALLLKADSLGNFSAEPFRLLRLWRDFGINTVALVAKCLAELQDHDLVRCYVGPDDQALLHIPRFGQRQRYLKRAFPVSPWNTNEEKQRIANNSPGAHLTVTGRSPAEEERREVKPSRKPTPPSPLSAPTWEAYRAAYAARWKCEPKRNATINSQIKALVSRLGNDAPAVAAFYLGHNDRFYVAKRHQVGPLLRDAEALYQQWKTGTKSTALEARSAEQKDALREQVKRVEANINGRKNTYDAD